jgi:hypothetical protein
MNGRIFDKPSSPRILCRTKHRKRLSKRRKLTGSLHAKPPWKLEAGEMGHNSLLEMSFHPGGGDT